VTDILYSYILDKHIGMTNIKKKCPISITNETSGELPVGANQYNVTVSDHK